MTESGEHKPKTKETMVDIICANIRRDIIAHELVPGQKINVKELAKRYGSSETPVKLALNRLIAEQIVENFPRHGMRIKTIEEQEVKEIFELRRMMDLYYTGEIIQAVYMNKRLRDALEDNVNRHYELVSGYADSMDINLYMENYLCDYQFHELYLKCSGNQKLVELYRSMNPFIYDNYIFHRQSKEKDIEGVKEHQNILKAIVDRDEEKLKSSIRLHLQNAEDAIVLILKIDKML